MKIKRQEWEALNAKVEDLGISPVTIPRTKPWDLSAPHLGKSDVQK